ncbi:hypothetical protein PoB_002161900 [Plakobranchus ocellatus]|uniref:SWIM-type domain-containing protein n=1 Tax=Plakobranchus ocellatus TaxID=259542 RepID=A0AAV3ZIG9_9GAST|nr:hypothetical protein PoB_002161900 [Plakobranchus ocellatus]
MVFLESYTCGCACPTLLHLAWACRSALIALESGQDRQSRNEVTPGQGGGLGRQSAQANVTKLPQIARLLRKQQAGCGPGATSRCTVLSEEAGSQPMRPTFLKGLRHATHCTCTLSFGRWKHNR